MTHLYVLNLETKFSDSITCKKIEEEYQCIISFNFFFLLVFPAFYYCNLDSFHSTALMGSKPKRSTPPYLHPAVNFQ